MALTTRDVILVLRAKDEASQTIRGVATAFGTIGSESYLAGQRMIAAGGALIGLGAAIGTVGLALLDLTKQFILTSMAYQQQAALTFTQVDDLGTSLADVKKIGLDVARAIPVPFEQVQEGLYQIFSSMDVTAEEAQAILTAFSKGAVAGQVDLQTAGAATIGIMNAFGLGIEDLGRVQDVQFQLVRKGVGTYEDFANAIGLALPSAVRSGQDIEHLSGMIAFLTRNGLSASRAATSAGRALELLANPKVVDRLEKMGIKVRNDAGEFMDINTIVTQLGQSMKDLTQPQRAAALQELFKGAGNNIQARRFWDTALANYDEFNQRTTEMMNAAGVADNAYDIMFNQPLSQIELLKNKWKVLSTVLGTMLVPALMGVVHWGNRVLDWLLDLPPQTQEMIAKGIALAGIIATLMGALLGASGAFLIFAGAIKMAGGIANIISLLGPLTLILLLIAGAAWLIYHNWDSIKPYFDKYWPEIQEKFQAFISWLQSTWAQYWPQIKAFLIDTWESVKAWWIEYWPVIREKVETFLNWLWGKWKEYWPEIKQFVIDTLTALKAFWDEYWPKVREAVEDVYNWIKKHWPEIKETFSDVKDGIVVAIKESVEKIQEFWNKVVDFWNYLRDQFGPGIVQVWNSLKENVGPIIEDIIIFIQKAWTTIKTITDILWPYVRDLIIGNLKAAVAFVEGFWISVSAFFAGGLEMIRGFLDIIAGLMTGDWGRVWDGAKHILEGFVTIVSGLIQGLWHIVSLWFMIGIETVLHLLQDFYNDFVKFWGTIFTWLAGLGARIIIAVGSMLGVLYNAGRSLVQGMINGVLSMASSLLGTVKSAVVNAPKNLVNSLLHIGSPSKVYEEIGRNVTLGFIQGVQRDWGQAERLLQNMIPTGGDGAYQGNYGGGGGGSSTVITIAPGAVHLEIGSVRNDDDLDRIEEIVNRSFEQLVRQLNQPTFRST